MSNKSNSKTNTIQENIEKLDQIVEDMQSENISLDESFEKYKEGIILIKNTNEQIEKIETEVKKLEEENLSDLETGKTEESTNIQIPDDYESNDSNSDDGLPFSF